MRLTRVSTIVLTFLVAACGTVAEPEPIQPAGPLEAAPPPMTAEALPRGTDLRVRLDEALVPGAVRTGDLFTATVLDPVIAQNGQTVVSDGSVLTGMVTAVSAGTDTTPAALRLNVLRIGISRTIHPVGAEILAIHSDSAGAPGAALASEDVAATLTEALGRGAGVFVTLTDAGAGLPAGTIIRIRTRDTIRLR